MKFLAVLLFIFFGLKSYAIMGQADSVRSIPFTIKKLYMSGSIVEIPCGDTNSDQSEFCKFDLGANLSSFSSQSSIIKSKNYESTGTSTYTMLAGDVMTCQNIDLPSLSLGNYQTQALSPVVCDTDRSIVGLDAFAGKSIYIDNVAKKIIVGYKPNFNKLKVFEEDSDGHIILEVSLLNGKKTKAFFDTGASKTAVSERFVSQNSKSFYSDNKVAKLQDTFGNEISKKSQISNLSISDQRFVAEYMLSMNFSTVHEKMGADVNYIIGQNIISENNWYFDFENKLWYVE